jgi:hypothetical protein
MRIPPVTEGCLVSVSRRGGRGVVAGSVTPGACSVSFLTSESVIRACKASKFA